MKKTLISSPHTIQSHPYYQDSRFEETFKCIQSNGYTHYAEVSRNGNCFYTSLIVDFLFWKKSFTVDIEKSKKFFSCLGLEEFVWEEYTEKMYEFLQNRKDLRENILLDINNNVKGQFDNITTIEEENHKDSISSIIDLCISIVGEKSKDTMHSVQLSDNMTYAGGNDTINQSKVKSEKEGVYSSELESNTDDTKKKEDFTKNREINEENMDLNKGSTTQEIINDIDEPFFVSNKLLSMIDLNELTMFFKLILSAEFLSKKELYEPFIEKSLNDYITSTIQPMYKRTDIVDVIGIGRALGIDVHVFGINGVVENIKIEEKDKGLVMNEVSNEKIKIGIFHGFDHFEPLFML